MIYYFILAFSIGLGYIIPKSPFAAKVISYFLLLIMFILMVTVVLLNPYTSDMQRYLNIFEINSSLTLLEALSIVRWEPGFVSYQWILARITKSESIFIITTILIMWVILIVALRKIIDFKYLPLLLLGYLSFFYFYNFSMNVVRQGIAVPLIVIIIIYLGKHNYKKSLMILLIAMSFHISSFIASVLFLVKRFKLSIKFLVIIFVINSFLMLIGLNENLMSRLIGLFGGVIEETVTVYASESRIERYGSTNRIDFLLFTTTWIILGLWFRHYLLRNDHFYEWLLKAYLSLSSLYVLFAFISYSDRIAAYAWFLIPILLFYPVTKIEKGQQSFWIIFCIVLSIIMYFYFDVFMVYEPLKLYY